MPGEPLRVLLVEDDESDVYFMRRALAKAGLAWDLEVARDGDEALDRLRREPRPSRVLLDLKLPKRTGLSVLAWIRERAPATRVIVLTSSDQKSDRDEATRLGVDLYLIKPVDFPALVELCREIAAAWKA